MAIDFYIADTVEESLHMRSRMHLEYENGDLFDFLWEHRDRMGEHGELLLELDP